METTWLVHARRICVIHIHCTNKQQIQSPIKKKKKKRVIWSIVEIEEVGVGMN